MIHRNDQKIKRRPPVEGQGNCGKISDGQSGARDTALRIKQTRAGDKKTDTESLPKQGRMATGQLFRQSLDLSEVAGGCREQREKETDGVPVVAAHGGNQSE
jgi:hypothetical protein